MKATKWIKVTCTVIFALAGMAVAQAAKGAPSPSTQPGQASKAKEGPLTQGLEKLNLSADQKAQVQKILDAHRQEMKTFAQTHKDELQAAKTQEPAQRKATMEKLRTERMAMMQKLRGDIRAVLTPDQQVQFDKMGAEAGKGPMAKGPMAMVSVHRALAQVNLTDDQKAKVKEIFATARETAKTATTPEAKKQAFSQAVEQIKTTVLTKDQAEKFTAALKQPVGPAMTHPFGDLNLTADQTAQVEKILKDAQTKVAAATTPQAKRDIRRQAMDSVVNTVLTADQKAQFLKEHPRFTQERQPGKTS